MSYQSPYDAFIFEDYSFDQETKLAAFHYSFDGKRHFTEQVSFNLDAQSVNQTTLEQALQLSFLVAGTSYYKCFPTKKVIFKNHQLDEWQAKFARSVYTDGLSQFMFENSLTLEDMPEFTGESSLLPEVPPYTGEGIIALQSGGKDSLLLAALLEEQKTDYSSLYLSSSTTHPEVLDTLASDLKVVTRLIDKSTLTQAAADGGLNGHVPVTYIVLSYALVAMVLQNKQTVLASIGAEGGEAHAHIGNLAVNHQWSKTWEAEQLFAKYVAEYISPTIQVGSPLRGFSELRIAELFVEHAWKRFGHSFSSCNRANYEQGMNNQTLKWCGECPKCANSYLLFAPFVEPTELQGLFAGQDLFTKPMLQETFKGLLGVDNVMKPFECVGEVAELRFAYHLAQKNYSADQYQLPFSVPLSTFDYQKHSPAQNWASQLLTTVY